MTRPILHTAQLVTRKGASPAGSSGSSLFPPFLLFFGGWGWGRHDLVGLSREKKKKPTPAPTTTPTATRCEDDDDWLYDGKDGRGCAWIAEKTFRCDGKDGAREACPATCGECEPACEDDETWFSKKSSNNCRWVAEKPDSRCSRKSDDKVKAKMPAPWPAAPACKNEGRPNAERKPCKKADGC